MFLSTVFKKNLPYKFTSELSITYETQLPHEQAIYT